MKNLQKVINSNWCYLLLIILIIPTFYTLIRPGYFFMQDDLQAFRIQQMDKCFVDLQIPCRWVPDAGYQYGYPQFNYYPPSVYYLGEAFHLLGFQFIDAVKILFILGFIASSLAMFLLLRAVFGNWPAFVGSLLYSYIPYKAVEVYVRGAMNEFWALVFFPLIFWASYQLIKLKKTKYVIWLAISSGLLLITHNLMSLIFFPIVGFWILTWIILEKNWKGLIQIFLSFMLGLGLAAFFTLPVLIERPYAHLESLLGGYFDYRQHFVNINLLFLSNRWGYGSSGLGQTEMLSLSTGIVQWVMALLAIILALINFKKTKKLAVITLVVAVSELLVLFLIHQKSSFIWEKLPILAYLQFPWRFLADSIFLLSFLSASTIYFLQKFQIKKISLSFLVGVTAVLVAFLLTVTFFTPREWLNISDLDKFSGKYWEKQLTISIFDYLPIYAKLPPPSKAPELPEVLDGQVQFLSYKKGSDFQEGEVIASGAAKIRLPLFDFPGMLVYVDNKIVPHQNNDCSSQKYCLGLISFYLNQPGSHLIRAQLTDTPIRTVGNWVSLLSIIIVVVIIFRLKIRND